MQLFESISMATQALTSNKLRSALTMLGIVIGNASVITMVGIGQGAQKLAEDEFKSLGPNTLFVVPGTQADRRTSFDLPKTLVLADAEAIAQQVPSVAGVAPQINTRQVVTYQQQNANISVIGANSDFVAVRSFEVAQGRFINDNDLLRNARVVVLGSEIATRFFKNKDPLGQRIRVKNITVEVVGVMESKGAFLGTNQDEAVYLPITTVANQIVGRTSPYGLEISVISVSAKNAQSVSAAKFQIENLLRLRHDITGEDDFTVRTQKDVLSTVETVTGGLTIMLAAIASISLLVGGIGVMNIMLVSVTERTQEIGLRKALGAKNSDILSQFLIEAVIVSAIGGVLGTIIGVSGVFLVGVVTPLSAVFSPITIILAVGVSGGIGLFFGVFPARRAAKLDPIVALRRL